jgi:hypothetical protein
MKDTQTAGYFVLVGDEERGPLTVGQLRSMWASGQITGETPWCQEGMREWRSMAELVELMEPGAVPQPVVPPGSVLVVKSKSRALYILLAILFGWCGLHNLYALRLRWFGLSMGILFILGIYVFGQSQPTSEEFESDTRKAAIEARHRRMDGAFENVGSAFLFMWLFAVAETGRVKKDGNGNPMS